MKYLNLNAKTGFILWIVLFPFYFNGNAQVTIGSHVSPEKAALLQLKDKQSAPHSKAANTTTGGLLLPRVELIAPREFSLIPNATESQKKDHTGLLVYNLKEDAKIQLHKGVYQWNGEEWKMMRKTTKTDGMIVKRSIYRAKTPDENNVVSVGIFEFQIGASSGRTYSCFRLSKGLLQKTIYGLVNRDRDRNIESESGGWSDPDGQEFYFAKKVFNMQPDGWSNILEFSSNVERHEIWLSDLDNDNLYHVQFLIFGNNNAAEENIYSVIVQKY
ncbi:MAG: hypothetical protein LBQ73_02670 [Tannerellaceae bacterium]|jgi:hypothetical protein|nr:hypothetical protein [Tannerellaceae bacterium]